MNNEKLLDDFNKSLDAYRKYEMEWLTEHGYDIYDIGGVCSDFEREYGDREGATDNLSETLDEYLRTHISKDDNTFMSYRDFLNLEYKSTMRDIARRSTKEDVIRAINNFEEQGMLSEKKAEELRDYAEKHKKD